MSRLPHTKSIYVVPGNVECLRCTGMPESFNKECALESNPTIALNKWNTFFSPALFMTL